MITSEYACKKILFHYENKLHEYNDLLNSSEFIYAINAIERHIEWNCDTGNINPIECETSSLSKLDKKLANRLEEAIKCFMLAHGYKFWYFESNYIEYYHCEFF